MGAFARSGDGDQKWLEHRFCLEEHSFHDNECLGGF